MDDDHVKDIGWNHKLEEYFASTGEKAHCLSWLHKQCEVLFSWMTAFIDLPVIILSSIIGAINIGSKSLFSESSNAPIILGSASIFIATLTSIGTYFSWSKRAEQHRISYIYYSKMYRYLSVEMSLPRHERVKPKDLLKYIRNEYDRLSEISPLFPRSIIKKFNDKFKNETQISQPEEVNGLEKIAIYNIKMSKYYNSINPSKDDESVYDDEDSVYTVDIEGKDICVDVPPSTPNTAVCIDIPPPQITTNNDDVCIDIPPISTPNKDTCIDIPKNKDTKIQKKRNVTPNKNAPKK
jgi:hypothetical protein